MDFNEMLHMEHNLISRLLTLVTKELENIRQTSQINNKLFEVFSDFFITYIDVAHHGKEENIFFPVLLKKELIDEHKNMIQELLNEHKLGRRYMEELIKLYALHIQGNNQASNMLPLLQKSIKLYKEHIEKEDNNYFKQFLKYLTSKEQEEILQQFWRFNIELINVKYSKLFDLLEGKEI